MARQMSRVFGPKAKELVEIEGLEIIEATIDTTANYETFHTMTEPDPNWKWTDDEGHEHWAVGSLGGERFSDGRVVYPTLELRTYEEHCHDCGETWEVEFYVCPKCEQAVIPGTRPGTPRTIMTTREIEVTAAVLNWVPRDSEFRGHAQGRPGRFFHRGLEMSIEKDGPIRATFIFVPDPGDDDG